MAARVTNCSYLSAVLSDHNPIKMTWEMDATQAKSFTWRFKSYMLKDPEFIRFMRAHIDVFMEMNINSSSHAFIWEALKAYMRGQILSYSSHKIREKRRLLRIWKTKLETWSVNMLTTKVKWCSIPCL